MKLKSTASFLQKMLSYEIITLNVHNKNTGAYIKK